jgi:hypothetical protein
LSEISLLKNSLSLVQFLNVARCFPPQPEGGDFPWRDFAEGVEESTSAAPTASHIEKKKLLELCPRGNNKDVIIIILVHDNVYIPC